MTLETPTTKTGHKAQRNEKEKEDRVVHGRERERVADGTDQTEITAVNYASVFCSVLSFPLEVGG